MEAEHKIALLLLCRPYHLDLGLNYGLLEEFQALGYPVLTIRSIPKDKDWNKRWFKQDLAKGLIDKNQADRSVLELYSAPGYGPK